MKYLFISTLLLWSFSTSGPVWLTDLDEAKALAQKDDKKIVLVFQGSDWCAPCIKLSKEVWDTEEFTVYAKDHYVMLQADFPRKKKNNVTKEQYEKNVKLVETYNKAGFFPFVVVLNKNGDVLGEAGYEKMSPGEYIQHLESFK